MSAKPSAKTGHTTISGMIAVILVWSLAQAGIEMPDYVATAIGALACMIVAWLVPAKSGKHVRLDDTTKH